MLVFVFSRELCSRHKLHGVSFGDAPWCLTEIGSCSLSLPRAAPLLGPYVPVSSGRVSCLAYMKQIILYWAYQGNNALLFASVSCQDDRKSPILVCGSYRARLQGNIRSLVDLIEAVTEVETKMLLHRKTLHILLLHGGSTSPNDEWHEARAFQSESQLEELLPVGPIVTVPASGLHSIWLRAPFRNWS